MSTGKSRPLHLHTLETLCADLVAGLGVEVDAEGSVFSLRTPASRGVFSWYSKNKPKWSGDTRTPDVEAIVDAAGVVPPTRVASVEDATEGTARRFMLRRLEAHHFAGLHHAGTTKRRPESLKISVTSQVTMLEGLNGCGKTSFLNAIVWALTGEMLRPQRAPETGNKEFSFEIAGKSQHVLPPVVPLPDPSLEVIANSPIPLDTWVELEFEDQDGAPYKVRRSLSRGPRGAVKEELSGFDFLGLDPISERVGTTMPGLLPYVQLGSVSALGKAVSELTGMAPLVQLASHATRAKKKIEGDFTKAKTAEIDALDESYLRAKADLEEVIRRHALDVAGLVLPVPSEDETIELELQKYSSRLGQLKSDGLSHAKHILGDDFDADVEEQRTDLVDSIVPALNTLARLSTLPSLQRLAGLKNLKEEDVEEVRQAILQIRQDSLDLAEIAAEPRKAARVRLYARVSAWIGEHPSFAHDENKCAVCEQDISLRVDSVTGLSVKEHLGGASKEGDFAGMTFRAWSMHVFRELSTLLPASLKAEVEGELVDTPAALICRAIGDELFLDAAFSGSLKPLQTQVRAASTAAIDSFPEFEFSSSPSLGDGKPEFLELNNLIERVERALAFRAWREIATTALKDFVRDVVGQKATEERGTAPNSLMGQLLKLQSMVVAIQPIDDAFEQLGRLDADIKKRRSCEQRLKAYVEASSALAECINVGELAERQVEALQALLHESAASWRNRIYQGAFPSTNMELVGTKMSGGGDLQFMVGAAGIAAPAQHVSNASALRASLFGFFLAYWQYMLTQRGGLYLLLLDDPQELLDGDNRDKLADAVRNVVDVGAQLILTTHDTRFASAVAKRASSNALSLNHYYVHPATVRRGTIFLTPSVAKVQEAFDKFDANPDDAFAAQEYASECRVFLEGRLGDLFDDGVYPAASTVNFAPTLMDHLGRLRGLVNSAPNPLFRSPVVVKLVRDAALKDGSPVLALLNKAHHGEKKNIRPTEVVAVKEDLARLRQLVERAHEEFRSYIRREPLSTQAASLAALTPVEMPSFRVTIQPNLKAFVRDASYGESQEVESEELTSEWFKEKAFFYVRSESLGFAGPRSSVAIVDVNAGAVVDRQLVIARSGKKTFARRLLRPQMSEYVALAAESPDPRRSAPTELLPEEQVSLHPIVGMLFGTHLVPPQSKNEAVQIPDVPQIQKVCSAFRISEESAVPLALPGQVALGGPAISLDALDAHIDDYVALRLGDGTSIFKRVGRKLPAPLANLRQFEAIGGLGVAEVLAIGAPHAGFGTVVHAVLVVGVLYS